MSQNNFCSLSIFYNYILCISEVSNPITSFDFEGKKYHLMLASGVMTSEDTETFEPIFNQKTNFGITKEKISLKQSMVRAWIMSIYIIVLTNYIPITKNNILMYDQYK